MEPQRGRFPTALVIGVMALTSLAGHRPIAVVIGGIAAAAVAGVCCLLLPFQ